MCVCEATKQSFLRCGADPARMGRMEEATKQQSNKATKQRSSPSFGAEQTLPIWEEWKKQSCEAGSKQTNFNYSN